MADYSPKEGDQLPIDLQKDDDIVLCRKINARIADADSLHKKKLKQYKLADAYFDGHPEKADGNREKMIYNPLFPIIRNMVGLSTDSRPHPSVKISAPKNTPKEQVQELLEIGDDLEKSLDDWWEDGRYQSTLQRIVLGEYTYSDFFVMPYWHEDLQDVCVYELKPHRVKLDPNTERAAEGDFGVVEFYRSKLQMIEQFGEEKCNDIKFSDYRELRDFERDGEDYDPQTVLLKNVCKLELFMQKYWWVFKVGDKIIEKIPAPYYAASPEEQKKYIKKRVEEKYKKDGLAGVASKVVDSVKGAVGLETSNDKKNEEIETAMKVFEPKSNYLRYAKLPIIHFDTYRMSGELYSRSTMELSMTMVDEISKRKNDISTNSNATAKPNTVVDGTVYNENDVAKLNAGAANNEAVRLNTTGGKSLNDSIKVLQGTPLPAQFFNDLADSKRELDTLWGHHEVSKGAGNGGTDTKGGIIALQEADQTPIRYISRNIEDSLQELFEWVVQIRKIKSQGKDAETDELSIDYSKINKFFRVFVKSGSMMPVSKEAQRIQAIKEFQMQAIDPLTYHERVGDPDPEKTAKRLESWLKTKTILTDEESNQQERVMAKIKLIENNEFDKVVVAPDDDPRIHHDILLLVLKSNRLSPEQEQFVAQLINQYEALAQGSGQTPVQPPLDNNPATLSLPASGGAPAPVVVQ